MQLIEHYEVPSGGVSSIVFDEIPDTFTDLQIQLSLRQTRNFGAAPDTLIKFNSSTTGYSATTLYSDGTSTNSAAFSTGWIFFGVQDTNTASTFGNSTVYIPNYRSSSAKSVSSDSGWENNATAHYGCITATLWTGTDAITQIEILPEGAFSFMEFSSATLYGITAGSDGIVAVS